jgi:putative nucleotidyltransferase with HDIG domain
MTEMDIHKELANVVAQLNAAVTNTNLYAFTHPQVAQYIDKAYGVLTKVLAAREEVTLMLVGNDLVAESRPLPADSAYVQNFARMIRRKAVERVTFVAGLPRNELMEFIRSLASQQAESIRSSSCVKLGRVELRVKQGGGGGDAAGEAPPEVMEELLALTAAQLDDLKDLYLRIRKHKQIDVRGVDEMVKRFIKGFREEASPLKLLASIKSSHEYTFTHTVNVGILTMAQAESLGFTGDHLHHIGVAALLHDVGKLFIPEEILSKAGKLTDDERHIIESHTTKGARYLLGLEGIPKLAVIAALEHHRKFDGSGYPDIKGHWTPNIVSQMICVADVFDAMRSKRSYQEAHSVEKIASVLEGGSGKAFNPVLVDYFLKLVRK